MALIKCSECGKEISDKATVCTNCGCPVEKVNKSEYDDLYAAANVFSKVQKQKDMNKKNVPSTGRLVTGIILIVISVFSLFQSCSVGILSAFAGNSSSDAVIGLFTSFVMMIIGIVSVVTRNSKSIKIPLVLASVLCIYGIIVVYIYAGEFGDLKVYGWVMIISSIVYTYNFNKMRRNTI